MQPSQKNLLDRLTSKKIDAAIVTNPTNIFYLTGFKGVSPHEHEALLVITRKGPTLITARLYQQEALKVYSRDLRVKIAGERNEINNFIKDQLKGLAAVAFEEHDLTFSEFRQFKKLLKGTKLKPVKHLVEDIRITKTSDEIKNIERAQIVSQIAFGEVVKTLKIGQRETEIAETLIKVLKSLGSQGIAFEPIVASGPNAALPHYVTGQRKIKAGDALLFDFGARFNNYCADLSRTVFVGRASSVQRNIYAHVETAQKMAIAKISEGAKAKLAHNHAAKHFKNHNLDTHFLHSLGHGIGLEVHESPHLSAKSKDILRTGMVFSVEPGLYFPEWGGIRISGLVCSQ